MERKNEISLHKFCVKCGSPEFKDWNELTSDEKFIAERTSTGKFSDEVIKHKRFCARCFYADESVEDKRA